MSAFHHPYNFIPVTGQINGQSTNKTEFTKDKVGISEIGARHDLWLPGTYSGRIVCRLHLHTPTVVGAQQVDDGQPSKLVIPYERNGQPAIPGSSLRGMVGSVAETLSQSALRVLADRAYSVRKPVGGGLSALGILEKSKDLGRRFDLSPLTIPVLRTMNAQYKLPPEWRDVFNNGKALLAECLFAYVDGYVGDPRRYDSGSFLDSERPKAFDGTSPVYYYAKLAGVFSCDLDQPIPVGASGLKEKTVTSNGRTTHFLLGRELASGPNTILTESQYTSHGSPGHYTKGFLRVLGIDGRESKMPKTKKHEVFIPLSQHQPLPVLNEAIERFEGLAEERNEDDSALPFVLKCYPGWKPQAGQLFFFDVKLDKTGKPCVSEISISSIWRKRVEGSTHEFFRAIDPDLVPWNPGRKALTPAELMFGVVEEGRREKELARNLASRVRFFDALPLPDVAPRPLSEKHLKILSSPKPPSPALYFHSKQEGRGTFFKKTQLNKNDHLPNGRKVYLHHPEESVRDKVWETSDPHDLADQKLRCTPLEAGQDFYFHVDFDNLTKAELTLLLLSLRPSDSFRHRLGLGKPLGLGTVEVVMEGVFFIDRMKRYSTTALDQSRYHSAWRPTAVPGEIDWQALYHVEVERLKQSDVEVRNLDETAFHDQALIDRSTLNLLNTIGDSDNLKPNVPVSPPLLDGQSKEKETFKWFVENEKQRNAQALPALTAGSSLPTMDTTWLQPPPRAHAPEGSPRRGKPGRGR